MAINIFTGNATNVAKVVTYTPANVEVDDIFKLTVTGLDGSTETIEFIATAATVANVTAGLTAAWNASSSSLCTGITAADNTTHLTLTADIAGIDFNVLPTTEDGGGNNTQTLTESVTTANTGKYNWNNVDNWSEGTLPGAVADENIYIENTSQPILYGLDQLGIANALASLNIPQSYTGYIGSNYQGLSIKTSALNIGYNHSGQALSGSGRIIINLGSTACAVYVENSGISIDTGKSAIRLQCNNANTTITVVKGSVDIATEPGESATLGTVMVSYVSNVDNDARVNIGQFYYDNITLTTFNQNGGTNQLRCDLTTVNVSGGNLKKLGTGAITTVNQNGGAVITEGSGAVTTYNIKGGMLESNSTGTITTLDIDGGTADFTKSLKARTITTVYLDKPGVLKYDPAFTTITNKVNNSNKVTLTAA
jgi:hypothetical protein